MQYFVVAVPTVDDIVSRYRAGKAELKSAMLNWIRRRLFATQVPTEIAQARALIRAIDRGGIPLHPGKVNAIARNLGLEVSFRAPVDQTIQRIRACLARI